jgi:predicted ABC-type ATPase
MFFQSKKDALQRLPDSYIGGERTDFGENYEAGKRQHKLASSFYSRGAAYSEALEPILADIKQKTGVTINNFGTLTEGGNIGYQGREIEDKLQLGIDHVNKIYNDNPSIYKDQPLLTKDFLQYKAGELARAAEENYLDVASRSDSVWGGLAAGARGEMLDILRNPITAIPMFYGGFSGSIAKVFLRESLIAGGEVAFTRPAIASWRKSVGLDYTWNDFLLEVGTATAAGGFFGVGVKGTISGIKALRKAGTRIPKNIEAEINKGEMDLEDAKNNPLDSGNPLDDQHEHTTRINESIKNIINDETAAPLSEKPIAKTKAPKNIDTIMNDTTPEDFEVFRPNDLIVDAKQFQFKEGGDKFGVSDRLKGVKTWEAEKSGSLIVYERLDGSKIVVDGHQRLGLAKRILSQNDGQDPKLIGFVLKESDGITPEEAMIRAAMKNIAEGTGSPIDAAKVLRLDSSRAANLPQASNLIRTAQALSNLSDEAFGIVNNGIVPGRFAAIVGRLVQDKSKHAAILKLLNETDPSNVTEAESIVRQAMNVEFTTATNVDLFGEQNITESLFKERATILDKALKTLRADKNTFNNLVRNQSRIEQEGNQLATNINKQRAINDATALQIIQNLANKKGGISDALSEAAKKFKEEGSPASATQDFVDVIRREIQRGNISGDSLGTVGRNIDVEEEGLEVAASPKQLSDFDDPINGPGTKTQGDILETQFKEEYPVKESFQKDVELRQDLKKVIDEGADEATIEAHPAVVKAIDEALTIPLTSNNKNFNTDVWWQNRKFNFGKETVSGLPQAMARLFEGAKRLAWEDDKLVAPDVPVLKNREATIILGPPASGKSTIANRIGRKTQSMIIDADDVKKVLPEYQNGTGANAVHTESKIISNALRAVATDEGWNVIVPIVGHTSKKVTKQIKEFKDKGYKVNLISMDVTPKNAYNRMFQRFIDTGRLIHPNYVKSIGDKPKIVYNKLKGNADGYGQIDNNQPFGQDPTVKEIKGLSLQGEDFSVRQGGGPSGQQFSSGDSISESLEEIPIGERIDPGTGEVVSETLTPKQILADIEQDRAMLQRLEGCV